MSRLIPRTTTSILSLMLTSSRRMVDALGPAHLGDVHQALDPLLELHEGAVGHDVHDLAGDPGADRVFLLDVFPRAGRLLLEPERDLFAVLVDVQHHHLDLIVDLEHIAGMVDAAPAHVGDVQQAVDAAQVDERAEIGDVLDGPLANLADVDFLEQLLFLVSRA